MSHAHKYADPELDVEVEEDGQMDSESKAYQPGKDMFFLYYKIHIIIIIIIETDNESIFTESGKT